VGSATFLIVKKGGHYPDRVDTSQLVTSWVNKESAINHRSFSFHNAQKKIGVVNCGYLGIETDALLHFMQVISAQNSIIERLYCWF
jgi:hypothetical protein